MEEDKLNDCEDFFKEKYLQDYLERVSNILGISNPKYSINFGSKNGDNYVGVVYRVVIQGEKNNLPAKIQTIIKVPPEDEIKRRALQAPHMFTREHTFYTEIVPEFKQFLEEKNKLLENIPECYLSCVEDHKEIVCLEDLQPKGFTMRDRMKQMDFAHISLAFRALGRLHALSFALRDQKPDIFNSKINKLEESLFRPEFIKSLHIQTRFEVLKKMVTTALAEEDPKYTERFSKYSKELLTHTERSCDGNLAEPYAVLNHGDYWMNNMLFKYNDKDSDEDPQEIYLLDYQFSRYSSPATDISYALYCSCSQELRANHFDDLIKIYHESLSNYLSELGSDPEELFPYESLLNQLKNFSTYGAGIAMMVLPMFISEGEDIPKLTGKNSDLGRLEERIHRDVYLKNTLRDAYKDLIDRNFI